MTATDRLDNTAASADQPDTLSLDLAEVAQWACCMEPEKRVRAEHRICKLEEGIKEFIGYALTCRKQNTNDWMQGFAEAANRIASLFDVHPGYYFTGDGIRFTK